jgi:hypothetical protein
MKKLPPKMHAIVLPFLLSMIMTLIVSAISTLHALGINGIFRVWLESWLFSWAVAFPTLLFVLPLVRKLVRLIVEE